MKLWHFLYFFLSFSFSPFLSHFLSLFLSFFLSFFLSLVPFFILSLFFLTLLFWAAGMAIVNQAIVRSICCLRVHEISWNFMKFPAKYFTQKMSKRFAPTKRVSHLLFHASKFWKQLRTFEVILKLFQMLENHFLFLSPFSFTRILSYFVESKSTFDF